MMKKARIFRMAYLFWSFQVAFLMFHQIAEGQPAMPDTASRGYMDYEEAGLTGILDFKVYTRALEGMRSLEIPNRDIITIIDFTKPSNEKRLFVVDLKHQKLLYSSLVAHGKKSGENYADSFSNSHNSKKSSPGFYRTAEPYQGRHGYSLKLDGLEKGINDMARDRAIVIHGAGYVSEDFIQENGRLGRSWGCPALPPDLAKEVIDLIKEGSCLYIHTDHPDYLQRSSL